MKTILLTEFGSKVYGTNVPTSDTDYKAIFIPDVKDILLQRAPKTIVENTKLDKHARNTANDIDMEKFALHQYLDLLMQGQTIALDMLFTPKEFYQGTPGFAWNIIQHNKDSLLHRGTTSFVGYARQQAAKYGIKGTRVAALRETLNLLNSLNENFKLNHSDVLYHIYPFVYKNPYIADGGFRNEYIKIVEIKSSNGKKELHLEVCNRKIPFHATVKYAKSIFQKIFDEYGARTLQAEKNEGIDWKALYHAVRVCNQAKELLLTKHITFPRPEAEILLQIRKGELPYKQVAEMIENGLEELEQIKLTSVLQDFPDKEKAESIIENEYKYAIKNEYFENL